MREAANSRIEHKGTFTDGIFTWVDAKGQRHKIDGSAAWFEEAMSNKLTVAPARYGDAVLTDNLPSAKQIRTGDITACHPPAQGQFPASNS